MSLLLSMGGLVSLQVEKKIWYGKSIRMRAVAITRFLWLDREKMWGGIYVNFGGITAKTCPLMHNQIERAHSRKDERRTTRNPPPEELRH